MTQYLFLFTIGPVQSFISQSRKTQDLYVGSFLLSHLIGSVMKELEGTVNKCKFIFPNEEIKHKPNRFIAEIETDDVEQVGKDLKYFVENEFEDIANSVLNSLDFTCDDSFKDSFLEQIKTHFQIYWVALLLEDDKYSQIYTELERYLGAIKNVRDFQQLEETGRKCSLCGERNVLFYKKNVKGRKPAYIQNYAIELDRNELSLGEGLCAICFTKRFANKYFKKNEFVNNFPSTAEIAAMDWLNNISEDAKHAYKDLFKNFDEQLFYEENLRKEYLKKYGHFKDEKLLSDAELRLNKFYSTNDKDDKEIGKPPKYYALFMLDGDNMGKWLSGEYLQDEAKKNLKDFHVKMSKDLGKYAKSLGNNSKDDNENNDKDNRIIEPKGKLVYVGGDDVMAFVNLEYLFNVLKNIREIFPKFEELKNDNNEKIIKEGIVSTASAGVVIAHYKTPLSEVLKWAKEMEHEAKENGGRDAFAVAVLKRSGEIRKAVFKWQYGTSSVIETLENLIESLNENFSNTFIKTLGIEFKRLMDEKGKYENNLLIKTEMKRLIGRSCMMKRKQEETKEEFLQGKKQAIDDLTEKLDRLHTNSKSLDNFLSALDIVNFIAGRVK